MKSPEVFIEVLNEFVSLTREELVMLRNDVMLLKAELAVTKEKISHLAEKSIFNGSVVTAIIAAVASIGAAAFSVFK